MKKLTLLLSLSACMVSYADSCHPTISAADNNYLIGYGSLINQASRMRSQPSAVNAYPLEVSGYQRVWGVYGGNYHTTFLTIFPDTKAKFNAVYYAVDSNDLQASDFREHYYCRVEVPQKQLQPLGLASLPKGHYWIYAPKNTKLQLPNQAYPVVQSYVDLFIGGCMAVGDTYRLPNYAKKCITETADWPKGANAYWYNDRVHPRRPFQVKNVHTLDSLLASYFPTYYQHKIHA